MIFFEPVPLKVFMLRATEADKKVGTGRLLLLCMPYRSAAHAAIGLFVFALDSPKFYGALDASSTSRACVRKVGCRQRPGSAAGAAALKFGSAGSPRVR